MKAVIYTRHSSDNQREESIEGQTRECTAFAEKNGIAILRHCIDWPFSAKTDNCPEFQNMIKDSGKRLFDMIIVWKLDRFARNRCDSARHKADDDYLLTTKLFRGYCGPTSAARAAPATLGMSPLLQVRVCPKEAAGVPQEVRPQGMD